MLLIVRWYGKARIVRVREDYRTTVNFIQENPRKQNLSSFERYILSKTGEIRTKSDIIITIAVFIIMIIVSFIVGYFIILPVITWCFSLLQLPIIIMHRIVLFAEVLCVIYILICMYSQIKVIIKTARFFNILIFIIMICVLICLLFLLYDFISINKL